MAVPEQTPYIEHTGNGVTTSFSLGFQCESKDHLIVLVDEIEPPIATWSLTGGNVVFTTAPAAGKKITLQRNTPFGRTANYQSFNNSFRPQTVNVDFDRIWWKLQELGVADWLMKLYVDRLHQQQEQEINDLKDYVDDRDDELRAYLMEEIRKQGVALDQLDDYYNYLMQRLAQIAVDKGWDAAFVVDASGKNQQVINNNTAYFYHTVLAMIADETLTDGKIVATKGYHNIFDDGGAIYLISAEATDYSIPLANGLHAVFRDSFDIRKFGIQDNATLDQTESFKRMIAYADTREYEIDFHNFSIMTPLMSDMGFNSIQFKGMIFNHVHKLKNLKIANNKTTQLQQNTCQIVFLPKTNVSVETLFELDNVVFDPYVADHNITGGSYDGNMHGFIAHPHIDSGIIWWRTKTMYSFKFKNITFASAAISYNLTPSAIYAERVIVENCSGDYIGLFCNHFANKLEVDGCYGVYRDDLRAAGRALVTSLLHEEPETRGTGAINPVQAYHKIKNVSSIKKSTGLPHEAYKHHSVTKHTLDLLQVERAVGQVFTFGPITGVNTTINKLVISECDNIQPQCYVKSATISNSNALSATMLRSNSKVDVLTLNDVTLITALSMSAVGVSNVQQLNLNRVITTDAEYGFIRNPLVNIDAVNIKDCKTMTGRAFECKWSVMTIDGFEFKDVAADNAFFLRGSSSAGVVNAVNMKNVLPSKSFAYHFMADAGALLTANVRFSDFGVRPAISNATLNFELSTPNSASVTYDPPSIAANATISTTVTLSGALVGDAVQAAFNQYNANIEVDAVVSSNNTVTVKFKNTSAAAVDLPSGKLTVKLV